MVTRLTFALRPVSSIGLTCLSITHCVLPISYLLRFSTTLDPRNSGFTQTVAAGADILPFPLIRLTTIGTGWHSILSDLITRSLLLTLQREWNLQ